MHYQWYTNGTFNTEAQAGQTNSTTTFPAATNKFATTYIVIITNALGKATSNPALLTILTKPIMTVQPQNVVVTNGNPAMFTSAANGPGPLQYQWYFHTNTLLAGATNTFLIFTNAITNLVGYYDVRVTNSFGAVTSSFALLTVSNSPNFLSYTFNPANGSFSFAYANLIGSTNRLLASSNLLTWHAIATNIIATNGLWLVPDTNTARTNAQLFLPVRHAVSGRRKNENGADVPEIMVRVTQAFQRASSRDFLSSAW